MSDDRNKELGRELLRGFEPVMEDIFAAVQGAYGQIAAPIIEQLNRQIAAHVAEALSTVMPSLVHLQETMREAVRAAWPMNWEADYDVAAIRSRSRIISEEGIPLVWVPRAQIVVVLDKAPGAEARRLLIGSMHSRSSTTAPGRLGR